MHNSKPVIIRPMTSIIAPRTRKAIGRNRMNDTEFHQLADLALMQIEEGIDESGVDIEPETTGNVLTLEFANRSQIVINRQEPLHELWLASKSGGYHFKYTGSEWRCTRSDKELFALLKQECSIHAGETVAW
jgi:CyaY protein